MKEHILAALREQHERWVALLAALSQEQITAPRFDLDWSIQDVMAHLWGWQQTSIARMRAGATDMAPHYPAWLVELPPDWEENPDETNAWIYRHYHSKPWPEIYRSWSAGYERMIAAGEAISEKDLLDTGAFTWLDGFSLAFVLIASYDHHQEHYDKVVAALQA